MNIYFLKNLETGRYYGDELLPDFEQNFYIDYEVAREAAWFQNRKKNLSSRNKYVVEVKVMTCPIMYVRYGNDCMRRFFEVKDAIRFYENNQEAYEIGYFGEKDTHSLDLTKDWRWTDQRVDCIDFDDSFWNSSWSGDFMQSPGKRFAAYDPYHRTETKKINISTGLIDLDGDDLFVMHLLETKIRNGVTFADENGTELIVKERFPQYYYDFGGSYTGHEVSWWYPNGRLYTYISLYTR